MPITACGTPFALSCAARPPWPSLLDLPRKDRKSTRLNSSHANISYAVFCLKKKITQQVFASADFTQVRTHFLAYATRQVRIPSAPTKQRRDELLDRHHITRQRRSSLTQLPH